MTPPARLSALESGDQTRDVDAAGRLAFARPRRCANAGGVATHDSGEIRLLILGGTAEAVELARACAARLQLQVISSLAGRTRAPGLPLGEVRIGGFGGPGGLTRFLAERAIDRVIDATHPFAVQIGTHAELACREAGVLRLRLLRPPWTREPGDHWIDVADLTEAARRLPSLGRRIFLTIGHQDLAAFARIDLWFLVRAIEPLGVLPLGQGQWLAGRGPFGVEDEIALLRTHAIDVLVTKASGGDATYAKLAAARQLGLPVVMVRRPPPPPGPVVELGGSRAGLARAGWLTLARRAQHMVVIGRVQPAVEEILGRQRAPDHNQRAAGDPLAAHACPNRGQGSADDALVGPGRPVHHDRRAVLAADRRQLAHHSHQIVDRQMNGQRGAGRREGRQKSRPPASARRARRCGSGLLTG